jgi:protein-disulfide isomerase
MRKLSRAKQAEIIAARQTRQDRQRLMKRLKLMAVAAVLAIGAVAGLIVAGNATRKDDTVRYASQAQGRVLGDPQAPVLIEAWEDYQCPICKAANSSVLEQIDKKYIATGVARLEFRNFAFIGPESTTAAEAAECAAEQNKFWPYHDALYDAQRAENSGAFSNDKLKVLAMTASLDRASFNACFDDHRYKDVIANEKTAGMNLGVNATPTFFVNGKRITDWRDYDAFAAAIDKAAADKAGTAG